MRTFKTKYKSTCKNRHWFLTLTLFLLIPSSPLLAQVTVGGTTDPQNFSILEIVTGYSDSNGKSDGGTEFGGLRLPRLTTEQRDALQASFGSEMNGKAKGLTIYNITSDCVETWNGSLWIGLCGPAEIRLLSCGNNTITVTDGTEITSGNTFTISYYDKTGADIVLTDDQILSSTLNGLTVKANGNQTLSATDGNIDIKVTGTPTATGNFTLPYTVAGKTCSIRVISVTPTTLNIQCPSTTPTISGNKGVALSGSTVLIPYTISGTPPFTLPESSDIFNGLTALVPQQTLTEASGNIIAIITGTPVDNTQGIYTWSIPVGETTCNVNVSITTPPIGTTCGNNNIPGMAFVFSYGGKWYVVKKSEMMNSRYYAALNEHDSEDDALRDPEAVQFCYNPQSYYICLPVYNRDGSRYGTTNNYFSMNSFSDDNNGILSFEGCSGSIHVYAGDEMSYSNGGLGKIPKSGKLAPIRVGGKLYLGAVSGTGGILTTKGLMY
ncbi:MAG: hypothetical protein LIO93_07415 [Bacteroidales bacterium]|nr:hypothetical protein [Bacteroidales bacterium]